MECIQDSLFGKTSPEHLAQTTVTILGQSLKKSQRPKFQYLDLDDGQKPEWLEGTGAQWLGEYSMLNIGVSPNVVRESTLSQILEVNVSEKYFLSKKACLGILRRAEKRGKKLPPVLEMALKQQAGLTANGGGISGTVSSKWAKGTGGPAGDEHYSLVCLQPTYAFSAGNSADARSIGFAEELSPTLKGSAGGNTVPVIAKPTYAIRTAQTSSNGWGLTEEISYTLDLASGQAVAYPDPANTLLAKANLSFRGDVDTVVAVDVRNLCETEELSGTLQSKNTGGYSLNYQNTVRIGYRVRRLTPTECLRLQGFPDNWLDIEGASDSAKYKAVGNSVAEPCPDFIFERVVKVLERSNQHDRI